MEKFKLSQLSRSREILRQFWYKSWKYIEAHNEFCHKYIGLTDLSTILNSNKKLLFILMLNFEWVGLILLNIMLLMDQLGFLFSVRLHIRRFLLLFFILDFRLSGRKSAISSSSVPAVFFCIFNLQSGRLYSSWCCCWASLLQEFDLCPFCTPYLLALCWGEFDLCPFYSLLACTLLRWNFSLVPLETSH